MLIFGLTIPLILIFFYFLNTTDYMFIQPDFYSITEIVNREFKLVIVMQIKTIIIIVLYKYILFIYLCKKYIIVLIYTHRPLY